MNIIVVFEAISGVLGFALITGLAFARFARPTARVMFSRNAVVAPFEGVPTIMLRAVNQRHNLVLEAGARMSLLRVVHDDQGHMMRRFFDLELVRASNPVFALSWTVMHKITPSSPFYGMTEAEIRASGDEIIVVISGTDEAMAQTIHARTAYVASDLCWNCRFARHPDRHRGGTTPPRLFTVPRRRADHSGLTRPRPALTVPRATLPSTRFALAAFGTLRRLARHRRLRGADDQRDQPFPRIDPVAPLVAEAVGGQHDDAVAGQLRPRQPHQPHRHRVRAATRERRASKRSWTALDTLLTFCPPGPDARMKLSTQLGLIDRDFGGDGDHRAHPTSGRTGAAT